MSLLSPQVKENTLDPTHGAAVRAVIEAPLPGKRGTPWVNGGGRAAISVAAGSSVELSSPSLSFSTISCCSPAPLFSPYSPGPLLTPSRNFLMPRGRTQASRNTHHTCRWHVVMKTQKQIKNHKKL